EFYLTSFKGIAGMTFEELMTSVNHAVPAGVLRDGSITLNPPADFVLQKEDSILVFCEESTSAMLEGSRKEEMEEPEGARTGKGHSAGQKVPVLNMKASADASDTLIIGYNKMLPVLLREMPENVMAVDLAAEDIPEKEMERLNRIAAERNITLSRIQEDPDTEEALLELARDAAHIVVLNDHRKDDEEADMETAFRVLNLRDFRKRYGLSYNITVEMFKEHNQALVGSGDYTDFLVSSSMSSLILAQLAESPELIDVFREILSNAGNELYIKPVSGIGAAGQWTLRELRRAVLRTGYILLGYSEAGSRTAFNLPLDQELDLKDGDSLVVLGLN
ncbi:MAG: hypothetical protein IIY77_01435, partial [Lachnospiraceae bacterium]|nr:hypothetical protein [Lachnospiraceae bacterium]